MLKKIKDPRIAILSAILLIIAFLTYRYFIAVNQVMMMPAPIKVVEAETLALKDIATTTTLTGTIKAKKSANLSAQSEGILEIIIDSGESVKKDTIIAKIDNLEIEKNYELAQVSEKIAKDQLARAKILLKKLAIHKNEYENTENAWVAAQKNLADAKIVLDKLILYAPFDGIIGNYKIKSGQQVQNGDAIVSFYDPSALRVDFDIPAADVAYINKGQSLIVNGEKYQLDVVQKMLDDDKHMSPASVDIKCSECVIGANIDVELFLTEKKQVIVIPFEAVFLKNGNLAVYVIEDNKANLKVIELGLRQKGLVEVISGLEAGEVLITRGSGRLYPGIEVKINEQP